MIKIDKNKIKDILKISSLLIILVLSYSLLNYLSV